MIWPKKHGLGWGGNFDDAMHFSAMKKEYGAGIDGKEISRDAIMGASGDDYVPDPTSPSPQTGNTGGGGSDSSTTTTPDGDTSAEKKKASSPEAIFAQLSAAIKKYKSCNEW